MSRILSFTYGTVVYTIFLGCFLYAVGFIGDFLVPKSIDSGTPGPVGEALLINTLLLGLFAVQHTGMARKAFKRVWTKIVPEPIERSTYVLATCVVFAVMFTQWRPIPEVVWSIDSTAGQAVMYGLFALGWLTMLVATFMIHHFDLFGMRQVYLHAKGEKYTDLGFRTPGLYKYMRHPIQVGFLIAFWATPTMTVGHLLFSLASTGYILLAVKCFEERDLVRNMGDQYRDYMKQVPGFAPLGKYREPEAEPTVVTVAGPAQA